MGSTTIQEAMQVAVWYRGYIGTRAKQDITRTIHIKDMNSTTARVQEAILIEGRYRIGSK